MTGAAAAAAAGALENITVSHEIEERATALIEEDEEEDDEDSGAMEKDTVDQGAFQSEDPTIVPPAQVTVSWIFKNLNFWPASTHHFRSRNL